jgi:hypothetical protein
MQAKTRGHKCRQEAHLKFQIGDDTDKALCVALQHEFMRCRDAFDDFAESATQLIMLGQDRQRAYRTYNAYARFIHHLYEFLMGAIARDRRDTAAVHFEDAEREIMREAQRALTNRRDAIINGTAPAWENALSAYAEKVPPEFAREFRRHRNVTVGHVKPERRNLSLTAFYTDYHQFLYMIYSASHFSWGSREGAFPDLKEVTDFSVMVAKTGGLAGEHRTRP